MITIATLVAGMEYLSVLSYTRIQIYPIKKRRKSNGVHTHRLKWANGHAAFLVLDMEVNDTAFARPRYGN